MEADKRRKAHPLSVLTGQEQEEHSSTHKQATVRPRASGVFFARRRGSRAALEIGAAGLGSGHRLARATGWLGALTDLWNRLISGCWLISGPLAYPRRRPPPHLRPTRHPAPSPRVP